jgi:uncharacterized Fe-S cluster-containing radical SAM superfamily enzyme
MSYSYLQAVFPKFEQSKIYDDKIYSSLDSISLNNTHTKTQVKDKKELIEASNEIPNVKESEFKELEQFNVSKEIKSQKSDHQDYITHILECNYCKDIIKKQFHLENEKLFKEEMIELISFIAFGIFLLMFLERSKK